MRSVKKNIKANFDKSAKNYDENSHIQKNISNYLHLMLKDNKELIKFRENCFGLDLGCGTGEFSERISETIKLKKIHLIDISGQMIERAKKKITSKNISFEIIDFEEFNDFQKFNFIFSNMSLHWSDDFYGFLKNVSEKILVNTILLFSFPNSSSFEYFKNYNDSKKKMTNNFPDTKVFLKLLDKKKFVLKHKEIIVNKSYNGPLKFFLDLKKIGANTCIKDKHYKLFDLRKNKSRVNINFNVSCLFIKKIKK